MPRRVGDPPTVGKRPGVGGILQEREQHRRVRLLPEHPTGVEPRGLSAGELQPVGPQEAEDFLRAAQLAEFAEDQADAVLNALIGVELGRSVGIAEQTGREMLHQLAPPGLREPTRVQPQADTMKLRFR